MYPSLPKETSNLYPDLNNSEENDSHEDYEYIHEFKYTNSSSAHKDNLRRRLEINNKEKIRKVKEEKVNESNNESNRFPWNLWKYITTFLIFLSSICILLYRYLYSTFQPQQPSPMLPQYFEEIEKLKPNYGGQTNEFWNVIRSFPYFLLSDKNPEGPAVLLMVASAGSLGPALQLSKQIARTLNNLFGSHPKHLGLVDGTTLSAEFPNVQKMMIDEQIRNMVDDHGHRAVIVTNLEKIDPKAIMIFHAYCDNTEAVYKNIAIILLLELPPDVQAKNSGDVYTHLSHIWSLLGRSRTHALFSRMANNIAILKAN